MKVIAASLITTAGGPIAENRRGPLHFSVQLLLDRLPDLSEHRYRTLKRGNLTYYASIVDGIARFFCHDPRDQRGYGGRTFEGFLEDGTAFSVRGPWSSGPSEINALGLFPGVVLVEASGTTDRTVFSRGYTFYSLSGVTLDIISQAESLLPGWVYKHDYSYQRHPASFGASEEQTRAIEHPSYPFSTSWIYEPGFKPCKQCKGQTYVEAAPGEKGAWKSERQGCWLKVCPTCGHSCESGIIPVPGMRWKGKLIERKRKYQ